MVVPMLLTLGLLTFKSEHFIHPSYSPESPMLATSSLCRLLMQFILLIWSVWLQLLIATAICIVCTVGTICVVAACVC